MFAPPKGRYYAARLESVRVFAAGYYAARLRSRKGIPVEVSCWKLMRRSREDGGRETGGVDVSLEALQLPHDNGSLLELVPEKNLRRPSC